MNPTTLNLKSESYNSVVTCTVNLMAKFYKKTVQVRIDSPSQQIFKLKVLSTSKPETLSNIVFGFTGKTDSSWVCRLGRAKSKKKWETIVPFEYKSGGVKEEHRYQVMLYLVMAMKDVEELVFELESRERVGV